jgi:hypothetical protein
MGSALHGDDLDLLLVDGDNLLHAVRGGRDDGGVAWLLPRLSRWRPAGLRIVVALDGHPAHGETSRRRAATGIEFHHAGARSADDLIIELLSRQPFSARARSVVVTRDLGLTDRARRAGGLTRTPDWLTEQLDEPSRAAVTQSGPAASQIGQGKPPRRPPDADPGDEERPTWQPGRGATRKRGNPRRGPRAARRR